MTRVLIADDEPLARRTLRDHLSHVDWIEQIAEVGDGLSAIRGDALAVSGWGRGSLLRAGVRLLVARLEPSRCVRRQRAQVVCPPSDPALAPRRGSRSPRRRWGGARMPPGRPVSLQIARAAL